MSWNKKGLIHTIDHYNDWMISHACVPTSFLLDQETIRIFYAPRNSKGQSIPTFIDVEAQNPSKILKIHDEPILQLGELGTFDDGGIMPCSIIEENGLLYMYYVGWNPSVSVDYRNAIGLAISKDKGLTFEKKFPGSILERNRTEPFFTASPYVMKEKNRWHMWYASGTGFIKVKNRVEPLYKIKYASSENGIDWIRPNKVAIEALTEDEANARPTVIKVGNTYKMWFCYRGSYDFRDGTDSYKIGYAESSNAVDWKRMDEKAGIGFSAEGWDSKMQTYPNILRVGNKLYLFYNGNGFGKTGIGYAEKTITE